MMRSFRRRLSNLFTPCIKPTQIIELSDEDYSILTQQTNLKSAEIVVIMQKFNFYSRNGVLNKIQFKKLYSSLRHEDGKQLSKICDHIFKVFDFDHNNLVSFNEFMLAFLLTSTGTTRTKLEYVFAMYDIDHDGYVKLDGVSKVLSGMYKLHNIENDSQLIFNTERSLKELDTNNDGIISKDEFINGLLRNYALRSMLSPFN